MRVLAMAREAMISGDSLKASSLQVTARELEAKLQTLEVKLSVTA